MKKLRIASGDEPGKPRATTVRNHPWWPKGTRRVAVCSAVCPFGFGATFRASKGRLGFFRVQSMFACSNGGFHVGGHGHRGRLADWELTSVAGLADWELVIAEG